MTDRTMNNIVRPTEFSVLTIIGEFGETGFIIGNSLGAIT